MQNKLDYFNISINELSFKCVELTSFALEKSLAFLKEFIMKKMIPDEQEDLNKSQINIAQYGEMVFFLVINM